MIIVSAIESNKQQINISTNRQMTFLVIMTITICSSFWLDKMKRWLQLCDSRHKDQSDCIRYHAREVCDKDS